MTVSSVATRHNRQHDTHKNVTQPWIKVWKRWLGVACLTLACLWHLSWLFLFLLRCFALLKIRSIFVSVVNQLVLNWQAALNSLASWWLAAGSVPVGSVQCCRLAAQTLLSYRLAACTRAACMLDACMLAAGSLHLHACTHAGWIHCGCRCTRDIHRCDYLSELGVGTCVIITSFVLG